MKLICHDEASTNKNTKTPKKTKHKTIAHYPRSAYTPLMTAEKDIPPLHHAWYSSPQGQGVLDATLHLTQKALAPWHRRGHCILQMGFDHGKSLEFLWQSGFDVSAVCSNESVINSLEAPLRQCVDLEYRAPAAFDHLPYADKSFDYVIVALPPAHALHAQKSYPPLKNILREALRIAAKGVLFQGWNSQSLAGIQHRWRPNSLPAYMQDCTWHSWRHIFSTFRALHPQQAGVNASTLRTHSALVGPVNTWKVASSLYKGHKISLPLPLGALVHVRLTFKDQGVMSNMPLYVSPLSGEKLQPASATERTAKLLAKRATQQSAKPPIQ